MIRLSENGAYIVNGEVLEDGPDIRERLGKLGVSITKEEAKKNTREFDNLIRYEVHQSQIWLIFFVKS